MTTTRRTFALSLVGLAATGGAIGWAATAAQDATPDASGTPSASPESSPAATPATAGGAGASEVAVSAIELKFEPAEFTIAANTDVAVTLTNNGVLQHDLVVTDLGVATRLLNGGESETITINAPAGTYDFICSVPGHKEAGMVGTLTVA